MHKRFRTLPGYVMNLEPEGDNGGTGTPPAETPPAEKPAETPPAEKPAEPAEFTPEQQARIDKLIADRLERDRRARAPKPAPKQAKGDEEKPAELTALEERLAELEAEREADRQARAEAEAAAARAAVATREGKELPAELLAGPKDSTKESLEAWADQLLEWRGKAAKGRPQSPAIGRTAGAPAGNDRSQRTGLGRLSDAYATSN